MLCSHYFLDPPTRGQFAKSNVWESAWSFSPSALPTTSALETYLTDASDVAFEVFFGASFLGIQLPDTHQLKVLARGCMDALDEAKNAMDFVNALRRCCGLELPFQQITSAAIGATNAWLSVGPFAVSTAALSNVESFWNDLAAAPVAVNATHPKVLEVVYAGDTDHWLAVPVSVVYPPYGISREALFKASQLYAVVGD